MINHLGVEYIHGLVSIIIPVYNRCELISRTVDSVLGQIYDNYEIIIVNDGSTDNTLEVLNLYASKYPEKIIIINQENKGQVRARNKAIRHARGEFIAFLDSDDTWTNDKLALQIPLFRGNVGLVYSAIDEVGPDGNFIRSVPCEKGMRGNIYSHLLIKNRMTGGSVVVRLAALEKAGFFDESLRAGENWDLWIRISKEFEVDFVDRSLVRYCIHQGNMSKDGALMSQATWNILRKHIPAMPMEGKMDAVYRLAYANFYYREGVRYFSSGDYRQARKHFFDCWKYKLLYQDSFVRLFRTYLGRNINTLFSNLKRLSG